MHYRLGTISLAATTVLLSLSSPLLPLDGFEPLAAQALSDQGQKDVKPDGIWKIDQATTPDRKQYTDTVTIKAVGQIYGLLWKTSRGNKLGVGLWEDGHLFASWGEGESTGNGVMVYQLGKDGSLVGKWTVPSKTGTIGTELVTGGKPGQLEGDYQVKGTSPNGGQYQGTLTIRKTGNTYQLVWNTGGTYRGIGILSGDRLVVGWGTDGLVGVTDYTFKDNKATGRSAVINQPNLDTENLVRSAGAAQIPASSDRQAEVLRLTEEARLRYDRGEYREALERYQQALKILREMGDSPNGDSFASRNEEINTLYTLAELYSKLQQPSQEIDAYEQMHTIACVADDRLWQGNALLALSRLYTSTNQAPKVRGIYEQTPAVSRSIDDYKREACELLRVGIIYDGQYQSDKAIEFYQQALTIYRNIGNRKAEASVLWRLGGTYQDLEQYPKAIASYEQELAVYQNVGDRQEEIGTLGRLAELYRDLEQYTKMIEVYQKTLAVSRAAGAHEAEVNALFALGDAYWQLNQQAKAIEVYEQVPAVFRGNDASQEEKLGQRKQEADVLKRLGSTYLQIKQYSKAIKVYQQLLLIAREIGRGNSTQQDIAAVDLDNFFGSTLDSELEALINLSVLHHLAGQSQAENEFRQQALAVSRNIYGSKGEFYVTYRLAGMYNYSLGRYSKAIKLYQQALTLSRTLGNRRDEISALSALARAYLFIGPYQKAVESYQQATEIYESLYGDIDPADTEILINVGMAYHQRGQYAEAIRLYEQVINTSNNIEDPALARVNLGISYHALGQYQKAIDSYQQALTVFQKDSYRRKFNVATTLDKLGMTYQSLGQHQTALKSYQQALSILQKDEDARNETAMVLDHLGVAYQSLGETQQAIESHQQALAIFREISNRGGEANALNNLGETQRSLGQYDKAIAFYQQSLAIKQDIGDRPGEGLSLSNLGKLYYSKGQYADAETSLFKAVEIWETLRSSDLTDENKISLFETQAATYRYLQQALIAQNKTDAALEVAERGRARAFVELLAKQLSPQSNEPIQYPSLEQIKQIAQQKNATLVQYSIIPEQSLYIWVIQPNGTIDFHSIDLKTWQNKQNITLADLVTNTRESLGLSRSIFVAEVVNPVNGEEQTKRLQQLHQLLIEPIAKLLPTEPNQRVIFIPQGELFLIPFAAIQDEQGKYLIEKHTILTSPAIQVLQLTRQQRQRVRARHVVPLQGDNALIVGNPTMPSVPSTIGEKPQQLTNLPGAQREAEAIAPLLNTKALTGNAATETAVKAKLPQARIVHLATHGLFDDNQGLQSAIALAPTNTDNGLLTATEILNLKLNAELVVLSACDTGRGRITGDGVIGLSRSLFLAGTPSVIVSLWAVPDAPTEELMTEFYRQFQQTGDKAQALRITMLKMKEKYPNTPKNWAAFTLLGEPI